MQEVSRGLALLGRKCDRLHILPPSDSVPAPPAHQAFLHGNACLEHGLVDGQVGLVLL